MKPINDGSRPSRVALARVLTGETTIQPGESAESLAEFTAEVAGSTPPPLDLAALRARAAALTDADMEAALSRPRPRAGGQVVPLFRRMFVPMVPLVALAAAALFLLRPPEPPGVRIKGHTHLAFDVARGGQTFPGDTDTVVQAGDRVRFRYGSAGATSLVLVGVDATGTVQTYWPDEGEAPVAIEPGDHVLSGSVQLDDAPGPEVFVAAFDGASARELAELVATTFEAGGVEALQELDEARADLAILVLEKR